MYVYDDGDDDDDDGDDGDDSDEREEDMERERNYKINNKNITLLTIIIVTLDIKKNIAEWLNNQSKNTYKYLNIYIMYVLLSNLDHALKYSSFTFLFFFVFTILFNNLKTFHRCTSF